MEYDVCCCTGFVLLFVELPQDDTDEKHVLGDHMIISNGFAASGSRIQYHRRGMSH